MLACGCVGATDAGPGGDGAPQAHPTGAAPEPCEGLLSSESSELGEPAAEDFEEARALFADGVRASETGDHAVALEAFCLCYRISPQPALLYNIAVTYERLGMHGEAADHYDAFVDVSDSTSMAEEARARAARLRDP